MILCFSMKRISVFILALVYITTSAGVTINMHYCMGELVEWGFFHNNDENCSKCGMKETESEGCCEDEQKVPNIDKEQKIAATSYQLPLLTSSALTDTFFELASVYVSSLKHPPSNAPQRWQNLPLFILNGVFRIWGFFFSMPTIIGGKCLHQLLIIIIDGLMQNFKTVFFLINYQSIYLFIGHLKVKKWKRIIFKLCWHPAS